MTETLTPTRVALPRRRKTAARYVATRALQAVFVVWASFTVSFVILYALPGDAVSRMAGAGDYVPPEQLAALRAEYGLDQPVLSQYLGQLAGLLRGDLGTSIQTGTSVIDSIGAALPETLKLTAFALVLSIIVGLALGLAATYIQWPVPRQFLLSLPAVGVAVPGFWIGLVLLWLFSFTIPLFPAMGNTGFASLVLPAVALAIPTSATIAQILASGLAQEWTSAYVVTAEAKGLSRGFIHLRHVLRNAFIPVLTVFAITVGGLLGGTVIAETIFARNGIGRLTQLAVTERDVPIVQGVVLLSAVIYAVVNLIADLLYPLLDPRIVTGKRGRRR